MDSRPNAHVQTVEYLRDKRWFRPDFMYDPTILSALKCSTTSTNAG